MDANIRSAIVGVALLISAGATSAEAAIAHFLGSSSDGHPVSATAEFTLDDAGDTIAVKLTNTTFETLDAGELFTGLDFSLGGLTPTLISATGIQREVDPGGDFYDSAAVQNLSWSLDSVGAPVYQLNFHPNAKDAILGPPAGADYNGSNPSVRGNPGHNPFAALSANFVLSVPGLEATTPVAVTTFRFGTNLDPGVIVPEPASAALTAAFVAGLLVAKGRRR